MPMPYAPSSNTITNANLDAVIAALAPFRASAMIEADDDRSVGESPADAQRFIRDLHALIGACALRIGNPAA